MRTRLSFNVQPLPMSLTSLVTGEGINAAVSRKSLNTETTSQLNTANNVIATVDGIGNLTEDLEGIGVRELTGTLLSTGITRAVIPFPTKTEPTEFLIIKGGNVYKMGSGGGNETLLASGVFSATAQIGFQYNLGGVSQERRVYICDGVNNPRYYNGTSLVEETQFNSPILGLSFPKPSIMPSENEGVRGRVLYGFPETSEFRNFVLASKEGDGSDFTVPGIPSNIDAFFQNIFPSDGGYITAFGVLKQSNSTSETWYVFKNNNKSYTSSTPQLVGGVVVADFSLSANNIGCSSMFGTFAFNNEIYALNEYGVGSFTTATSSGNSEAFATQFSQRVNPLIRKSSQNAAFSKSFILHCQDRNIIMTFMPELNANGTYQGYAYGETPMNYSIQMQYDLTTKDEQIRNFWSTRYGKGWGFSCGVACGKRIILGSYFGKVFELFGSNEYERNPAASSTAVPIRSKVETGDMYFGGLDILKSFNELYFQWQGVGGIIADLSVFFNQSEIANVQDVYTNIGTNAIVGRWDDSNTLLWDTLGGWAGVSKVDLNLTPSNEGKYVRLSLEWDSLVGELPNTALLSGMAGYLTLGTNTRNIR
jgi:hypothetical protein